MANFFDQLQTTLANSSSNRSVTENGAIGYKTTGKKLLDMNFAVSSLRNKTDDDIVKMYREVCGENLNLAIIWLFFARDREKGLGERRLFRVCINYLANEFPDKVNKLLPLIAEYGRWDDIFCLFDSKVAANALTIIKNQLTEDMENMAQNKSISLIAKWLPSQNTSSAKTRALAEKVRCFLNISPREYRKMLSPLRRYLDVVERKMSANKWENIKYDAVPSRANLNYNSAFLRHDEVRRREYLSKLEKGEAKINSSVLFPHDIVHKYAHRYMWSGFTVKNYDAALEAMWKSLPNTVKDSSKSTIVVADGSGSMTSPVGKTDLTAWEVAHALAIYFAEKLTGPYANRYITFSANPQLVNMNGATSLKTKLEMAMEHREWSNTNIQKVFELILETAIHNHLSQEELPRNILIISDGEFDSMTGGYGEINETLFNSIGRRFRAHGYNLPRLVFWNVMGRTGTIPVKENKLGVALVSGFSPNVAKMVMSNQTDPYAALLETLASSRYDKVREAIR